MADKLFRAKLITAFAAVYLVWGSTYLAIRFAIESIPPFLMVAIRFLVAGAILFAWSRWRSREKLTMEHWLSASAIGLLMLVVGNGGVVWAQQTVPSGITALVVALVPLWMVLLELVRNGIRPNFLTMMGISMGLGGIVFLIGPGEITGTGVDTIGALVLVVGTISWAIGSLYSRTAKSPTYPFLGTAMQMLMGGMFLAVIGIAAGERIDVVHVSMKSFLSLAYLVFFGSLIGYSAYIWILRVAPSNKASTYAFVNPIVAVILGWLFGGEELSAEVLIAMLIIVSAVALIVFSREKRIVTRKVDDVLPVVIPEKEIVGGAPETCSRSVG